MRLSSNGCVANNQVDAIPHNQFEALVAEGRVTEEVVSFLRDPRSYGRLGA
jgi:hypothetical protein